MLWESCKNIRCAWCMLKRAIEIISRQLSSKRFHSYFLIFYSSFFPFSCAYLLHIQGAGNFTSLIPVTDLYLISYQSSLHNLHINHRECLISFMSPHRSLRSKRFCSSLTHAMSQGIFSSFTMRIEWLFKLLVKVEAKKVCRHPHWGVKLFHCHWKF